MSNRKDTLLLLDKNLLLLLKKALRPEGHPFKQTITESGQKYLHQGKPAGFSISKGMSYVTGPNMKVKRVPKKTGVKHLTLKDIVENLMKGKKPGIKRKVAKKPAAKKKVAKKKVVKKKVAKKPGVKKKVVKKKVAKKKVAKKKVVKKKVVKKKVAKKPVVHKKGFAYKKHPSRKEYIKVQGKKRLIHKGNRGAEYYKLDGKKHYIPTIK